MLLHRLVAYNARRTDAPPAYYRHKQIAWKVTLHERGVSLDNIRPPRAAKGEPQDRGVLRPAPHVHRTRAVTPLLLADTAEYVLGSAPQGSRDWRGLREGRRQGNQVQGRIPRTDRAVGSHCPRRPHSRSRPELPAHPAAAAQGSERRGPDGVHYRRALGARAGISLRLLGRARAGPEDRPQWDRYLPGVRRPGPAAGHPSARAPSPRAATSTEPRSSPCSSAPATVTAARTSSPCGGLANRPTPAGCSS